MDQLHFPHSLTLASTQYPAPLPSLLFLLWSRISSPSLPLLMQHTVPALKPCHYPSILHLHLPLAPDINTFVTSMPQTRASGHAYTAPFSPMAQPCSKKLPLHSSTAYPIWLSPPSCILSWKCRSIHSTFFWRTTENHTAEQLETDNKSWSETSMKRTICKVLSATAEIRACSQAVTEDPLVSTLDTCPVGHTTH